MIYNTKVLSIIKGASSHTQGPSKHLTCCMLNEWTNKFQSFWGIIKQIQKMFMTPEEKSLNLAAFNSWTPWICVHNILQINVVDFVIFPTISENFTCQSYKDSFCRHHEYLYKNSTAVHVSSCEDIWVWTSF